MDVKEVIKNAKNYVSDVYDDPNEPISNLGLEEVNFDELSRQWQITLAFSRPWNSPRTRASEILDKLGQVPSSLKRAYKIITIRDDDGRVLSMKNRPEE